ncbi:hypothetical protein SAY87_024973 [Trapa incisa]|uniref:Uncharacterized protein n=1 Tax=Trapa incisa TaxID=236973 RepID=A0AAN7JG67_9MYRT|nr:hypothetical protein SAY87_024973 [Trapa incisa]
MADIPKNGLTAERDIEQAITAIKKGACLLKYGRRGKPKFCPFHLSNDESSLIWHSGKEERKIKLCQVSRIIPGQRTAIFKRYPRPEKEYQSFSLICRDRSLDLICKDKEEAEVWLVGLKAVITLGNNRRWKNETVGDRVTVGNPVNHAGRNSPPVIPFDGDDHGIQTHFEIHSQTRLGKVFCDIISHTATKSNNIANLESSSLGLVSAEVADNCNGQKSASDTIRVSLSSALSSSSQGSCHEDFDALTDIFIWGEGIGDGILGGNEHRVGGSCNRKMDATLPKVLESNVVIDANNIACGYKHAILVNRQGESFSWGEGSGGKLGHGSEFNIFYPKIIDTLSGVGIELVACGEYHSCAVTVSGELYTWGDGDHNFGFLGHGSESSCWIPKRVDGWLEGLQVSYIACGPWHTAVVASSFQLFTFGDGSFGALGHGDRTSSNIPREVEALRGLHATRVACGAWHTVAIVEVTTSSSHEPIARQSWRNIYTWGDGEKYQLGHGDREPKLLPHCVIALVGEDICRVACGLSMTVALTSAGKVFTMGSTAYGQLGSPAADGKFPISVEGEIARSIVEEITCGSYHVAALTSKSEVFTWGKGSNGQLGHGDCENKSMPTIVGFLKDKQVKTVVCGSNFTAVICLHKSISNMDHSMCSGCRNQFGFMKKRHNCYNCGLVFCNACSSRKSLKASLAPDTSKEYRVCGDCYHKLKKTADFSSTACKSKPRNCTAPSKSSDTSDKEGSSSKLQGHLSRSLSMEPTSPREGRRSTNGSKTERQQGCIFPLSNRNFQFGGLKPLKEPASPSMNTLHLSTTSSKMPSQPASPLSVKSSPPRISRVTNEDSKDSNDSVAHEIKTLRKQVEDLTSKSHHLEIELEKTTRKLKEVTTKASNEAQRRKTAKEVIKSLMAQLKEMVERFPEGQGAIEISTSASNDIPSNKHMISRESCLPRAVSSESGPDLKLVNAVASNGSNQQTDKREWIVQDEPGVYITLAALPYGGNELRKVRFSRLHFSHGQAEKWWAANEAKLYERHKIQLQSIQ